MYHAGDGDCLLISDDAGTRHLLVDGGRKGTFESHTSPDLTMELIDVVCVSHIDDDHISGILRLFDDEVDWRRHKFAKSRGRPTKEPSRPQPPKVKEVWHNALFGLLGDDLEVRAQNALTTSANLLRARGYADAALANENIVNGERSAMELARRLSPQQLNIKLNDSSNGAILIRDNARGRRFGRIRVKVIAPSQADIDQLRITWQKWIEDNPSAIDELRDHLRGDEQTLAASAAAAPTADLGEGVENITAPNLASIALLVEERGVSVLLTGDADSAEILHGLEMTNEIDPIGPGDDLGALRKDQRFHCTVLKVQHHGAEANITEEFVARVSADSYLFCGNGAHHNPELDVVRAFAEARFNGGGPDRDPADDFVFWFSSGSRTRGLTDARAAHMKKVEELVEELVAASNGQMSAHFMQERSYRDIDLPQLEPAG
jgi:hypothetical protein